MTLLCPLFYPKKMRVFVSFLLFAIAGFALPHAVASEKSAADLFHRHFIDSTLRVDYHRTGSRQWDTIVDVGYAVAGQWAGSTTQLVDPFDNGLYRIVVMDKLMASVEEPSPMTASPLYSRCYNTLFSEYRETAAGADSTATFEEVVRIPMPRHAVYLLFQRREADGKFHTQSVVLFDPAAPDFKPRRLPPSCAPLKLHYSGKPQRKVDIAIVPEGYGAADSVKLRRDLQHFCDYILAQEPFASRRRDINVWGLQLTSKASGITNPVKGIAVESLLGASYNTLGSDRYLMTTHLWQLHDVIGTMPCDHIVIMANSTTYGGGAIYNFYAMSSTCDMAYMVLPHELGHSIGGLADEYVDENLSYGDMHDDGREPPEPNITTLVDFASKWQSMLAPGTPVPTPDDGSVAPRENGPLGVYEGAGYKPHGVYRPVMHCMMRDYAPFCPVCCKRLNAVFDLYIK